MEIFSVWLYNSGGNLSIANFLAQESFNKNWSLDILKKNYVIERFGIVCGVLESPALLITTEAEESVCLIRIICAPTHKAALILIILLHVYRRLLLGHNHTSSLSLSPRFLFCSLVCVRDFSSSFFCFTINIRLKFIYIYLFFLILLVMTSSHSNTATTTTT